MASRPEGASAWPLNIGRAAERSGVSAKMIRHYESLGLLGRVARTEGNYRQYTESDVHTLRFIRRARDLGFSMDDITELVGLWQNPRRRSASVLRITERHLLALHGRIAALQSMARTLEHLGHSCHGDERPDCPILDDLAAPH